MEKPGIYTKIPGFEQSLMLVVLTLSYPEHFCPAAGANTLSSWFAILSFYTP